MFLVHYLNVPFTRSPHPGPSLSYARHSVPMELPTHPVGFSEVPSAAKADAHWPHPHSLHLTKLVKSGST